MSRTAAFIPSSRQREAIEAGLGPVLVLAGPGAGKTFCLIERIGHLIGEMAFDPARICAVTYTNKAAEEVATRLRRELDDRADLVTRSTIHSLAVRILREHGGRLELERGFGIADDDYQKEILGKLRVPARWRTNLLKRFTLHRLAGHELHPDDVSLFDRYTAYLVKRRMVDFDGLVLLTDRLFREHDDVAERVAGQFDYLLVDEFQDLNAVQYRILHRMARGHRNLFAVGDDEQSIFSWTGASPELIRQFANDFKVTRRIVLDENRRSAKQIFELARRLLASNEPLFDKELRADRESPYPVEVSGFRDEEVEWAWLVADLARDRAAADLAWGDFAILYRRHQIGDALEGALMHAGIPCRLAHGRSVSDDPVIRYVIAALRLILTPRDPIHAESFLRQVLPSTLLDRLRAEAQSRKMGLMPSIRRTARELPNPDDDGRKIRRALAAMANLTELGARHRTLAGLVEEILSQRVGPYQTALERQAEELSDPAGHPASARLAAELEAVKARHGRVMIRPMGGLEIGLAGMLNGAGHRLVDYLLPSNPARPDDLVLEPGAGGDLGLALGTFKALQLASAKAAAASGDFVAFDLETTDRDAGSAEIVEIAAARVRGWRVVEEFHRLVRPRVAIAAGAAATHGYSMADLERAPPFEEIWPAFRAFVGADTMVAHNGYAFDFPILFRMAKGLSGDVSELVTYDTLPLARWLRIGSAKLQLLAERFGIDPGDPHKALSDVRTLAAVYGKLEEEKVARARRVALANILDHLGVALALSDPETLGQEALMLEDLTRAHALGRFSNCLEFYAAERGRVGPTAVTVEELIERLGGTALMLRIRAEKRPDQRYPAAMARIRRLMEDIQAGDLTGEIEELLARVALSKSDGVEADRNRVNLLTLHATKGLEFSRVYVVGAEDSELPGGALDRSPSKLELEEARRLLYVGMTRARDRLALTRVEARFGKPTGGHRFLDEMGLIIGEAMSIAPGS